jgi:hypothetical protein
VIFIGVANDWVSGVFLLQKVIGSDSATKSS